MKLATPYLIIVSIVAVVLLLAVLYWTTRLREMYLSSRIESLSRDLVAIGWLISDEERIVKSASSLHYSTRDRDKLTRLLNEQEALVARMDRLQTRLAKIRNV